VVKALVNMLGPQKRVAQSSTSRDNLLMLLGALCLNASRIDGGLFNMCLQSQLHSIKFVYVTFPSTVLCKLS
jgi:hypothetical protein